MDGQAVVHCDLRADNILIRDGDTVVFVDWPWASTGAAGLDRLFVLLNVNFFGGHDVEKLVDVHLHDAPPAQVTGVIAGLAGYFVDVARRPAPDGIPTLRAFQRAQGEAALRWLAARSSAGLAR
jgi:aminoglycoside phosphotransferase (APT) family kinase protein